MDATRHLWHSAAFRDALDRRDPGAIVRLARRASNITLAELGAAVGYTAASLSRMERGKQPMRDVLLLGQIAEYLDIPPHFLGLAPRHGRPPVKPCIDQRVPGATRVDIQALFGEEGDDALRRRELMTTLVGVTTGAALGPVPASANSGRTTLSGLEELVLHQRAAKATTEPTAAAVTAAVDASRTDFGACRYDALARALPARITLAHALDSGGGRELAATAVAELYTTATCLCIKFGEDSLATVTADRAVTAALAGADALTVAEAHRMVSSAWRRQGHYARAVDIAVTAAERLTADRSAPEGERLSVLGNLYATAAYTAAKRGDRHRAHDLIAEARAAAGRLGTDALLRGAVFGPTQVALHQISISHLLGDAGQAIDHARQVDTAVLPTAERKARYWIDVARSFDQWGKPDHCYRALLAAERTAPQEVRRDSVRAVTSGLLRYDRTLPGVRAFAQRVGALS
ncbi:helix-turn-helix domain-containing protein [Streptomyces uncialis]|uniref:helix-turn-helix domain-containing protein n=1 Tax=Streptomyces uncialis TaxID=1048205 RepID=UPI00364FA4B1